ncbi:hypothetical protein BKA57DRAFT_515097 [Linnemannia elongata]|nr:hypothetical protein BKA57DRAFT_515097 [Linnemannia elongata]
MYERNSQSIDRPVWRVFKVAPLMDRRAPLIHLLNFLTKIQYIRTGPYAKRNKRRRSVKVSCHRSSSEFVEKKRKINQQLTEACALKTGYSWYKFLNNTNNTNIINNAKAENLQERSRSSCTRSRLRTRVGDLEDKISDITNLFEQMSIQNTGLKTKLDLAVSRLDNMQLETTGLKTQSDLAVSRMDNMQLENTGLKTKLLDLAVSRMDDIKAENTRVETKLDLAGYRMDEMQNTIDNSASVTTGIDDRIMAIQEEADKRLRRVARGTGIILSNKSLQTFDPEKLIWEDIKTFTSHPIISQPVNAVSGLSMERSKLQTLAKYRPRTSESQQQNEYGKEKKGHGTI